MIVREIDPKHRKIGNGYSMTFEKEEWEETSEKIIIINQDGTHSSDFYYRYEVFLAKRGYWIPFQEALDKNLLKIMPTHFCEADKH